MRTLTEGHTPQEAEQVAAILQLFNGATLDAMRGNVEGTVLASAQRTASNNSADQVNHNAAGVLVYCNVTNVPGVDTVQFIVQVKDPVSGTYINLVTDTAVAASGMRALLVYPGAGAASGDINAVRNGPLPRTWRVRVVHSGSGQFTYSVGYCLIG